MARSSSSRSTDTPKANQGPKANVGPVVPVDNPEQEVPLKQAKGGGLVVDALPEVEPVRIEDVVESVETHEAGGQPNIIVAESDAEFGLVEDLAQKHALPPVPEGRPSVLDDGSNVTVNAHGDVKVVSRGAFGV